MNFSLMITISGVLTGCQVGLFAMPTATPTNTPAPTKTSTPEPSATPPPTSTFAPTATLEPTPAPVGEPVYGQDVEITVLDVVFRDRIYPGGSLLYTPVSGYVIVDMGVRVKNLIPDDTIFYSWNQIYVLEDNGASWYPLWGSTKKVASGETFDPSTIGISSAQVEGGSYIRIEADTYLRLIYIVRESNQQIWFGISTSPKVEIPFP